MKKLVKMGVWTPWAKVLCVECHGPEFPKKEFDVNSQEWKEEIAPVPLEENKAITTCDKCGVDIQLNRSVATEHNLMAVLREKGIEAFMEQTGGMNSAVAIPKQVENASEYEYESQYLITYNFDGDNKYWLGSYINGDYVESEYYENEKLDEMVKYIEQLKDIPRTPKIC